ncbi:MAG: DNA polymerase elongation subunit, partial [Candidatus Paceibacteria bacterium]
FDQGSIDIDDIGIPGGIGQKLSEYDSPSAHVRGAIYANALFDTNFGNGSKPKHVYLEKVPPEYFEKIEQQNPDITNNPDYLDFKRNSDIICFEFADQIPEEFEIDYDKMLEKTIEGPISPILAAIDIAWSRLADDDQQAGLENFM